MGAAVSGLIYLFIIWAGTGFAYMQNRENETSKTLFVGAGIFFMLDAGIVANALIYG